ncbi:hypothetical protein SRHO_G00069940 [Serrasalmus rhombeus]
MASDLEAFKSEVNQGQKCLDLSELHISESFATMGSWFLLVLVIIVSTSYQGAFSCPQRCTCHFSSRTTEVVCPDASLTHFPSESLPGNTTSLTIQYTNLKNISTHELRATPLLQELHLPGNGLSSLPAEMLKGLPHLHTIDLTGNQLRDLPPQVFYHAPLLNLVLKDNLLASASADWLPSNSNLTWLDLSGNRLIKAPFALLQNLGLLETLHLSQNLLEELPADSFQSLPALERLHLDENKLQALDAKAFSCNTNLTHLFLQKNKLKSLPATVFHGLDRLQYLDLSENRLQFVAPGTLGLSISWVELNLNPWHCDSKMEYLWKMLNKKSVQSEPTCATPEMLKDRAIATLTRKELGLED